MGKMTLKETANKMLVVAFLLPYLIHGEKIPFTDEEKANAAISIEDVLKRVGTKSIFVPVETEDGKIEIRRRNGVALMTLEKNEATEEFFSDLIPMEKYKAENEMYRYEKVVFMGEKYRIKRNEKTNQIEEFRKIDLKHENDYRTINGKEEMIEFIYTITGGKLEAMSGNDENRDLRLIDIETCKFVQGSPKHVLAEALISMGMDKNEVYTIFDIVEPLKESDEEVIIAEEEEEKIKILDDKAIEWMGRLSEGVYVVEDSAEVDKNMCELDSAKMLEIVTYKLIDLLGDNSVIDFTSVYEPKVREEVIKDLYEILELGEEDPKEYIDNLGRRALKSKLKTLFPGKDSYSEEEIDIAMNIDNEEYEKIAEERYISLLEEHDKVEKDLEDEHARISKQVARNAEYFAQNAHLHKKYFEGINNLHSKERGLVRAMTEIDRGLSLTKSYELCALLEEVMVERAEEKESNVRRMLENVRMSEYSDEIRVVNENGQVSCTTESQRDSEIRKAMDSVSNEGGLVPEAVLDALIEGDSQEYEVEKRYQDYQEYEEREIE